MAFGKKIYGFITENGSLISEDSTLKGLMVVFDNKQPFTNKPSKKESLKIQKIGKKYVQIPKNTKIVTRNYFPKRQGRTIIRYMAGIHSPFANFKKVSSSARNNIKKKMK